ncbi:DUF1127 domain-containing protein [Limibaculum sp. FT325]|uniref:DUF1127 domain-containing protein n=1 Tax=Thermohalobaculum sediminis TaxID=2939436 RepID=UPI0020BEC289|nr:DUF1127 domain-containing protein [Limibaculum sediminis]MCL5776120.1 DUF1127 domain-containing protein [Limibaculum sediminis]
MTRPAPIPSLPLAGTRALVRAAAGLRAAFVAIDEARRVRRTIRMLQGLSDHALHDIGVARGEIEAVARGRSGHPRRRN